ncbi:MAG: YqeG family HAD IIIA-type phosphatase [Bacilli bacterium]
MNFKPTMYMKSIYHVDFKRVYRMGYRVLLIDLDNTLVPHDVANPTKDSKILIEDLKKIGFEIIILSNNNEKRVSIFAKPLDVEYMYSTRKPLKFKYLRLFNKNGYKKQEVLCIGDQIMTDVYGANRLGCDNMLVEPLAKKDILWTKPNRLLEKFVYYNLARRKELKRGDYYYE